MSETQTQKDTMDIVITAVIIILLILIKPNPWWYFGMGLLIGVNIFRKI